jgi:hypothetical protein
MFFELQWAPSPNLIVCDGTERALPVLVHLQLALSQNPADYDTLFLFLTKHVI